MAPLYPLIGGGIGLDAQMPSSGGDDFSTQAVGEEPGLAISLSTRPGRVIRTTRIRLTVTFRNVGSSRIRLLRHVTPLPVFFAFDLAHADGTLVDLPGAGKIDLVRDDIVYVTLDAGETFDVEVDLSEIMDPPRRVRPGDYSLRATYHNQYGENCFTGSVQSEPIQLTLASSW